MNIGLGIALSLTAILAALSAIALPMLLQNSRRLFRHSRSCVRRD